MVAQVGRLLRRSVTGEVVGAGDDDLAVLAQLACFQRSAAGLADADADVEALARQIARPVVIVDAQFEVGMGGGETREDRRQKIGRAPVCTPVTNSLLLFLLLL